MIPREHLSLVLPYKLVGVGGTILTVGSRLDGL